MTAPTFGVALHSAFRFDRDLARQGLGRLEDLGYDSAWFADHIVIPDYCVHVSGAEWLEPLTACVWAAGATERLRVGTDVLVVPYRDPVLVAEIAATADLLSDGRLVIGAGVGYIRGEFAALRTPDYDRRGAVTDEYVDVWRALWSTPGPVTFDGEFIHLDGVHAEPKPAGGGVPVWVGGNGPRAFRRAASRGDGWHPLFPTSEQYEKGRAAILEAGPVRGDDFTWSYSCPPCWVVGPGESPPPKLGYDQVPDLPQDFGYAPPMPEDPTGRQLFVGTAEQVAGDIAALRAAGVEHFTLRFLTQEPTEWMAQLDRMADWVWPHLR